MSVGLIVYQLIILLFVFLIMLNGYLRGSAKQIIDAGISIILMITLILAFFIFNWKIVILSIIAIFVYSFVSKPFAKKLAHRMLGYRTSFDTGSDDSLKDFTSGKISLEKYFEKLEKKQQKSEEIRLQKLFERNQIRNVLKQYQKNYEDFTNYFHLLKMTGLGEELAWEIISNPKDLQKLIYLKDKGLSDIEIAAEFMKL